MCRFRNFSIDILIDMKKQIKWMDRKIDSYMEQWLNEGAEIWGKYIGFYK